MQITGTYRQHKIITSGNVRKFIMVNKEKYSEYITVWLCKTTIQLHLL